MKIKSEFISMLDNAVLHYPAEIQSMGAAVGDKARHETAVRLALNAGLLAVAVPPDPIAHAIVTIGEMKEITSAHQIMTINQRIERAWEAYVARELR